VTSEADVAGTALDTSVIIPALLAWHEHHGAALPIVSAALTDTAPLVLPLPALVEAFAVLTRLPPPWRLRAGDAHRLLADTFREGARIVGLEGDEAWGLLDTALATEVAGGATYDAHIAQCAKKAGAARLATFNRRHFERLDLGDMVLLVPSAP
jgi:predicted nucleic acid-binding protein